MSLATPPQPSDLPVYIISEMEIQTERQKYSHMVLRNQSMITEGESDHVPRRRKEYM